MDRIDVLTLLKAYQCPYSSLMYLPSPPDQPPNFALPPPFLLHSPSEASHTFTDVQSDWGFSQFLRWDEFVDPTHGWISPEGRVMVRVEVTIERDMR